jgi:4a-hydroxytetrahydrobiopterin dehydratase
MTEALVSKTCTPCRGGVPPLTREQAQLFHAQAPDWQLSEEAHRIERGFTKIDSDIRAHGLGVSEL